MTQKAPASDRDRAIARWGSTALRPGPAAVEQAQEATNKDHARGTSSKEALDPGRAGLKGPFDQAIEHGLKPFDHAVEKG